MIYSHSNHAQAALDAVAAQTQLHDRIAEVVAMVQDGLIQPAFVRAMLAGLGVPDRWLDWAEQQVAERCR